MSGYVGRGDCLSPCLAPMPERPGGACAAPTFVRVDGEPRCREHTVLSMGVLAMVEGVRLVAADRADEPGWAALAHWTDLAIAHVIADAPTTDDAVDLMLPIVETLAREGT